MTPLSRKDRERLYRRQAMINAARSVFAEKGFATATIDEIAARAEFGKGTLYNYFDGGKEEILMEVIADLFGQLSALADSVLSEAEQAGTPFEEMLSRFVEAYIRYILTHRDLFLLIMKEVNRMMLEGGKENQQFVAEQRNLLAAAITPFLERAIEARSVHPYSASFMAHLVLGNVHGYMMMLQTTHNTPEKTGIPTDPEAASRLITRVLVNGIGNESTLT